VRRILSVKEMQVAVMRVELISSVADFDGAGNGAGCTVGVAVAIRSWYVVPRSVLLLVVHVPSGGGDREFPANKVHIKVRSA
jgi:hypothetical protein